MPETPRFQCRRCGNCCRGEGVVLVTRAEVDAIAALLGRSVGGAVDECIAPTASGTGIGVADRADGACAFIDSDNRCRIHAVRPRQ